jgi:hypothetical protein
MSCVVSPLSSLTRSATVSRLRQTGTHRGATFGLAPIGVPVEYAGAAVFTCRDHRIQDVWVPRDVHGLIWQLRDAIPVFSRPVRKLPRWVDR